MILPERLYYPLSKAAKKIGCDEDDLIHFGAIGKLEVCSYIEGAFDQYSINDGLKINDQDSITIHGRYCSFASMSIDGCPARLHFHGLMMIGTNVLRDIEFYDECSTVELYGCAPYQNSYDNNDIHIFEIATDEITITKKDLYITADEIANITSGKIINRYELSDKKGFSIQNESPKTTAKASELILPLLKIIPELSDIDFDNEKLTKIVNIIESLAASKGIELPKTHRQTWGKYIGRK